MRQTGRWFCLFPVNSGGFLVPANQQETNHLSFESHWPKAVPSFWCPENWVHCLEETPCLGSGENFESIPCKRFSECFSEWGTFLWLGLKLKGKPKGILGGSPHLQMTFRPKHFAPSHNFSESSLFRLSPATYGLGGANMVYTPPLPGKHHHNQRLKHVFVSAQKPM